MLLERGSEKVISFDIAPKPQLSSSDPRIEWVKGDITKLDDLVNACKGADCMFHIAALVGPFHARHLYYEINTKGTVNVIEACRRCKIRKIVCAGTPGTRMDGKDIENKSEAELPVPKRFTAVYAETKSLGEDALRESCCDELMSLVVAPHQVYGPRDALFLPNILNACRTGRLRVFGGGRNVISWTHVDNYCHALIIAERKLFPGSPCLGQFYVVTDLEPQPFWAKIDEAALYMGYPSVAKKAHLPYWLLMGVAYCVGCLAWVLDALRIAPAHKVLDFCKVNTFTVTMMTIHRYFNISKARKELGYEPLLSFNDGWAQTL
eukprot:CAMPEP_0172185816 /NCGR_PEP_ID=MMETSP1050-20130122/20385_1 /TAXON_ID=233186 /ORGANISM="Cryptomonas curvata, Strain CCAP979/52" /LENGTH=320 /DNA_ID=CAMNT_0012859855 /DNA_START=1 /DNA_END=960 /DNA_ORIENTATION=-